MLQRWCAASQLGAGMVDCLNSIPVDYVCFGNHESDIPHDSLIKRIEQFNGVSSFHASCTTLSCTILHDRIHVPSAFGSRFSYDAGTVGANTASALCASTHPTRHNFAQSCHTGRSVRRIAQSCLAVYGVPVGAALRG
eukprot:2579255-Amphidinium_carterae.1